MTSLAKGDKAPDFTSPADNDNEVSLSSYKGKKVVLYFYPKDSTPGCTTEACDFRDNFDALSKMGVQVIGASKDSIKSHNKFKDKHGLNFPLVSDTDGALCEKYGVWVEKNLYGRKYMGIERTTFLIDEQGKIMEIWRKVKVKGHIAEIMKSLS